MPRTRMTDFEERAANRRAVIDGYFARRGEQRAANFAARIGVARSTSYRKYDRPGTLYIEEVRRMRGITDDEILRLVRGSSS